MVLIHCDQVGISRPHLTAEGHNRSPTLALAFFLYNGHTLRQAYQRLLQARPDVDPLPSYRRGLVALELELYGVPRTHEGRSELRKPRCRSGITSPGTSRSCRGLGLATKHA